MANERTALAWQRTALSVVAAAGILGRLTVDRLGFIAVTVMGLAVLLSLWVFIESRWRYVQHRGNRRRRRLRGGRAALSLTVATCLVAVTEIAALPVR